MNNFTVDGYRFINHLHTTARQLKICSQITSAIGDKQLPALLLKQLLIKWSFEEEARNEVYKNSKGKLTDLVKKKETTAFNHYISLCNSLGLISGVNGFYSNARITYVLTYFKSKEKPIIGALNNAEIVFYFYVLLNKDADGLLLIFQMLCKGEMNQQDLQSKFKDEFVTRLSVKQENATNVVKEIVNDKYRTVNFLWQNAAKYAEHILIPRCQWLNSLGLINIKKESGSTVYNITENGAHLYTSLPEIKIDGEVRDINNEWILKKCFTSINQFTSIFASRRFTDLSIDEKKEALGQSLSIASKNVSSSTTYRLPMKDTLLFICIEHLLQKNIVTEFQDIIDLLKESFVFDNKEYLLNDLGRINESYITTRITK